VSPGLRFLAVISVPACWLSCNADPDPTSSESNGTTSSSSATVTTTTTTAATGAPSTSGSTMSSVAASNAASSASTSGTGGATTSATDAGSATTEVTTATTASTDAGGAAGGPNASTGGGGTGASDAGVFLVRDSCSHEACGGILANSAWRYVRACVTAEQIVGPIQSFCPSITLVGSSGELTGSISFDDTSVNQELSFSLTIELDVPADCNITCPSFAATLAVLGFPDTACEESSGGCRCVGTAQGTDPRSGAYETHESSLVLHGLGDVEAGYCAGENSFSYAPPVMLVPQGTPMDVVYETVPQ